MSRNRLPIVAMWLACVAGCASYESNVATFSDAGLCREQAHLEVALVSFNDRRFGESPDVVRERMKVIDAELSRRGAECRTTTILVDERR